MARKNFVGSQIGMSDRVQNRKSFADYAEAFEEVQGITTIELIYLPDYTAYAIAIDAKQTPHEKCMELGKGYLKKLLCQFLRSMNHIGRWQKLKIIISTDGTVTGYIEYQ